MQNKHYFPHDSDAHNDPIIIEMRMNYGWEFYGIYWAIIEILRNEKGYQLPENYCQVLSFRLGVDQAKLKQMLSKCLANAKASAKASAKANALFLFDGEFFYSESLKKRMEKAESIREKRRIAGKKGGKAKANATANAKQSSSIEKEKENKKEIEKENNTPPESPTGGLVSAYPKTCDILKEIWTYPGNINLGGLLSALRNDNISDESAYISLCAYRDKVAESQKRFYNLSNIPKFAQTINRLFALSGNQEINERKMELLG